MLLAAGQELCPVLPMYSGTCPAVPLRWPHYNYSCLTGEGMATGKVTFTKVLKLAEAFNVLYLLPWFLLIFT